VAILPVKRNYHERDAPSTPSIPFSTSSCLLIKMAPVWSYQPLKAFYLIATVATTPPWLILYALRCVARPLRPVRAWSVSACISFYVARILLRTIGATRFKTGLIRSSGSAPKENFVLIEPAKSEVYKSLPQDPAVQPVPLGSLWFPGPPPPTPDPDETMFLHLPGGAFVMSFPPVKLGTDIFKTMTDALPGAHRMLLAQYRLAHDSSSRFPAALQDAVTAYTYLLEQGISPKNIVICGDSAGGNLVLALARHLSSGAAGLPMPRGALIWSPWVDMSADGLRALQQNPRHKTDVLPMNLLRWGAEAYSPLDEQALPFTSPAGHPFKTTIPIMIHAGAVELLRDQARAFAEEMRTVNGEMVQYRETKDMPHDMLLSHGAYGEWIVTESFIKEAAAFLENPKVEA
jgi:acetyl esterase/lipase